MPSITNLHILISSEIKGFRPCLRGYELGMVILTIIIIIIKIQYIAWGQYPAENQHRKIA